MAKLAKEVCRFRRFRFHRFRRLAWTAARALDGLRLWGWRVVRQRTLRFEKGAQDRAHPQQALRVGCGVALRGDARLRGGGVRPPLARRRAPSPVPKLRHGGVDAGEEPGECAQPAGDQRFGSSATHRVVTIDLLAQP